ncbi:hypothetical protein IAE55_33790, partial [Paenibacillus sp. S28]|nr:hypothetical protein [Paenibacillus sp. S28]
GREWVRAVLRGKAFGWRVLCVLLSRLLAGYGERGLMLRSRTVAL